MIDNKKLLCAFIYSAYDGGYCGLSLSKDRQESLRLREEHKEIYLGYIMNKVDFPGELIRETQGKMMLEVDSTSLRDYIYKGHIELVKKRIEEETGSDFYSAIKSNMIKLPAISCPINYYRVISVNNNELEGENIVLGNRKKLSILEGLETPMPGQIVSGHWHHVLEVVSDWPEFEKKYLQVARDYYSKLK